MAFEGSKRATSLAYLVTAQWHLKDHKEPHLWLICNDCTVAFETSQRATSLAYLMTAQLHLKDNKEPQFWTYLGLRCGIWRITKSHISGLFRDCTVAFEGSKRATSLAYLVTAQWHLKDHKEPHLWLICNDCTVAFETSQRATSLAYLMTAQMHLKDNKEPQFWTYLGLRCGIWSVSKSHIYSLFSDCPVAFEGSQRATSLAYLMTAQWRLKDHKEQHLWLI